MLREGPPRNLHGIDPDIVSILTIFVRNPVNRRDLIRQDRFITSEVQSAAIALGEEKMTRMVGHLLRGIVRGESDTVRDATIMVVTRAIPLHEIEPKNLQAEYRNTIDLLKEEQNANNAQVLLQIGVQMAPHFPIDSEAKRDLIGAWMQFAEGRAEWKAVALGALDIAHAIPGTGKVASPESKQNRRAVIEAYKPGQTFGDLQRMLTDQGLVLGRDSLNQYIKFIKDLGIPLILEHGRRR